MNIRMGWRLLSSPAEWLGRLVGRLPAPIGAKLLVGFLAIVLLLIALGAVGLQVLGAANDRAEGLGTLQRKVSAYRQLQTEITRQLSAGSSAFTAPDAETLETTLRQLQQSRYNFDRLQFVAQDEGEILRQIESDYDLFIEAMVGVVGLVRDGKTAEALELQQAEATPLAERLDRLTNELVNKAEADMVATIEQNRDDYLSSRTVVIAFAVASIALSLVLGYAISSSLSRPVKQMDTHLRAVASGDFTQHVDVPNRDELGALAGNLNRMNDELGRLYHELEDASQHKSDFLANMSHELRTPLNAIIGFSEVLQERMFGELNEKQAEYVQDILSSGKHLLSLINDILDLSKIEAGRMELELATFSIVEALENGLSMVRERAVRQGVALNLRVDGEIGVVEADERKIKQVIFNLLSNAVKFTPNGGRVDVSAQAADGELTVAVSDTGIGIAPADQERIFDEFQQVAQPTAATQEGTGLGLALAKKFVEIHGGRIWVNSEPGTGSTFAFALPVRRLDEGEAALRTSTAEAEPAVAAGAGPTILVVEDDPRAIELLTVYLTSAGFNVAVARDGEEALEMVRSLRPAGITLDIGLPRLDGWDLLTLIKGDRATANIPVIIVSMLDERGKGFALGADGYMLKPVGREDLLSTLNRLTDQDRNAKEPCKVLAIDDDPVAIELIEAVLTPEGFAVLRAAGGEDGISKARRELPSLIIVDLLMPEVDGFTVVERLRADPATAGIPIVVLTAKSISREDKERLNSQISYLVEKTGFSRGAFVDLVRRVCQPA